MKSSVGNPLAAIAVGLLASGTSRASEDVYAGNTAGMGRTAVANSEDNAAVTVNPALLGLTERYDVQGLFVYGPNKGMAWGASLADSSTNELIGFGLSYSGGVTEPELFTDQLPGWTPVGVVPPNGQRNHDITAGIGVQLLERRLGFGLNGSVFIFDTDRFGSGVTGNMDLAAAGRPIEWITLGLVARNVLPIPDQKEYAGSLAGGLRVGLDRYVIGEVDVDWRYEDVRGSAVTVGAGLQGAISIARIRAGYRWVGDYQNHAVTWGIGIQTDVGGFEYAMEIPVGADTSPAALVSTFSVRVATGGFRDDGPMLDSFDP